MKKNDKEIVVDRDVKLDFAFDPNLFSLQRACYRHLNVWPCELAARLMAAVQHIRCVFLQLSYFSWMSRAVTLEQSRTFSRRNYANSVLTLPLKVIRNDSSGAVQFSELWREVQDSRGGRSYSVTHEMKITDQTTCWCCGKVLNYDIITYEVSDSRDSAPRCHNRGIKLPIQSLGYR